jgi:hypothetical protein
MTAPSPCSAIPSARRASQRGATVISVMLLSVSLMTVGLLVVRSSVRQVEQAGQLVARERALMAAQAAADLAAAQYLRMDENLLNDALNGYTPGGTSCTNPCEDCIPDATVNVTGQRNDIIAGTEIGCGGKPCMRQGAVAFLNDVNDVPANWCDVPVRDLVTGADAEARVSVWIRNNSADALGPAPGSASWTDDNDGRVVVTAMATIRNTSVTIEQELLLSYGSGSTVLQPQSPDEGYGGGHNNDNSAVSVCTDQFLQADPVP